MFLRAILTKAAKEHNGFLFSFRKSFSSQFRFLPGLFAVVPPHDLGSLSDVGCHSFSYTWNSFATDSGQIGMDPSLRNADMWWLCGHRIIRIGFALIAIQLGSVPITTATWSEFVAKEIQEGMAPSITQATRSRGDTTARVMANPLFYFT